MVRSNGRAGPYLSVSFCSAEDLLKVVQENQLEYDCSNQVRASWIRDSGSILTVTLIDLLLG